MKTKHYTILSAPVIQSGDQTQNTTIRSRWFALTLGGFLFTSLFALSAPPVEAQCQLWNVGHKWSFYQGPVEVVLDLHQNGIVITGTAIHEPIGSGFVSGTVDGTVKGDQFAVHIYWANNTVGVYNGTIRPSGRIEGTGYEQRSPSVKVNWYSTTNMECADAAPVIPKPIKSSGKARPATTPVSGSGTAGGFIQLHTPTPAATAGAEADESSSSDTEDQHGKHKNKKNKKRHHHHDDDDQNQGND